MKNNPVRTKAISKEDKDMANGMRNMSGTPLTEEEIEFIKSEIQRIKADEGVFVFNDPEHIKEGTCYNFLNDKVYVTRNVFPDEMYASAHPRDTMSVGAVLAHEYYGHRYYRQEYLSDWNKGSGIHTTPLWQDECRASLSAAHDAPGLTNVERRDLIIDAVFRAKEFGQLIEMDDFMKETVYGYNKDERKISGPYKQPQYVSEESAERDQGIGQNSNQMSKMRITPQNHNNPER